MKYQLKKSSRRQQRGVALIIVLGFLGLMVMMAVAFMVQARVERIVADSTLDGIRARQVAQTGISAAIQDYMNHIKSFSSQSDAMDDMFLSGDLKTAYGGRNYDYSGLFFDSTNLWNGEASDWLPKRFLSSDSPVDLDNIQDMEWIWVRQEPGKRSPILGRYAYACFNLSGGVDANLLGRDFGDEPPSNGYGAQTNRDNVRKMVLNGVRSSPSTERDSQYKLSQYQAMWQGFDTPATLKLLTNGKNNDGKNEGVNRWSYYLGNESDVGFLDTEHLSCYSYAATHYTDQQLCTVDHIMIDPKLETMVSQMAGLGATKEQNLKSMGWIREALQDYTSSPTTPPVGVSYPSVKDIPMFNEIKVEVKLQKPDANNPNWHLEVSLKPEFWCPFPAKTNRLQNTSYRLKAPATMAGGTAQTGSSKVWIRALGATESGPFQPTITMLEGSEPTPKECRVHKFNPSTYDHAQSPSELTDPYSPTNFVYTLNIEGMPLKPDGVTPMDITQFRIASVIFVEPWQLETGDERAVDSTPTDKTFSIAIFPNTLKPDGAAGVGYMEVEDPRLNHLLGHWSASSEGSMGGMNSCFAAATNTAGRKMKYAPGRYMYCRNGELQSPAELGYIPFYSEFSKTPWMTLDVFSESGVALMNSLVCNSNTYSVLTNYDVFYTNGTINPYTQDEAVLNGAFYGIDGSEVPGILGATNVVGKDTAKEISAQLSKSAEGKEGPGGWSRIFDTYKGFSLNKNERVAITHNTWGLFNESDSLFLVFVVAQSITEAPEKVNPVGDWNEKEDMITGERWAVALCWMDTSAEGAKDDLTQEMDIIMFKYLNE